MSDYHFLELFRLPEGKVWGVPIDPKPFNQLREEYDDSFHLQGRTANFFCVTRDETIRRTDAIVFATLIASGQAVYRRIDF